MGPVDLTVAAVAALIAGAINALAGGGTLVSFPALVAVGVSPVTANATNTVALAPGYLAGAFAQRELVTDQLARVRSLALVSALGGLAGSILLVLVSEDTFEAVVPFLILLSCGLLAGQQRIRRLAARTTTADRDGDAAHAGPLLLGMVFAAAVYGGFFGAGLGIMLLAVLGLFTTEPLSQTNAVKQALSFVVNLLAAGFLAVSGHVDWRFVPVMAIGSVVGGTIGGRLANVIDPNVLRGIVIVFGIAVALRFWL